MPTFRGQTAKFEYLAALAFCVVIIPLTHVLPACPLALTLYMCTSIHINFLYVYCLER